MSDRTNLIYRYDGTFSGLMCCVYESFLSREDPMMILPADEMQLMLIPEKAIETDALLAARVTNRISGKLSQEFMFFVEHAHLSALPGRERLLLSLIQRAFREGPRVLSDLADPSVNKLTRAVNALEREAHLYLGFVRFQVSEEVLTAIIEPKNSVLPVIRPHFCDRFSGETFLIYDKTHHQALLHHRGASRITSLEALSLPAEDEAERNFRALWQKFFQTIAIKPRENPRQQQTMLPGRYRNQMPEMTPPRHTAIS